MQRIARKLIVTALTTALAIAAALLLGLAGAYQYAPLDNPLRGL